MADSLDQLLGASSQQHVSAAPTFTRLTECPNHDGITIHRVHGALRMVDSSGSDEDEDSVDMQTAKSVTGAPTCSLDFLHDKDGDTSAYTDPGTPPSYDFQVSNLEESDLVKLNVGGTVFVTLRTTLAHIPNTRLSNLQERDPNYNKTTKEWFFDRNPTLFNCILDLYRTEQLHFPHGFCGPSIRKELLYWQIDETFISSCCWNRYREFEQEKKIFDRIERAFESKTLLAYTDSRFDGNLSKWEKWKKRIYIFMEEPTSSRAASVSTSRSTGLDWTGLDWTGLDWTGLDWTRLD